MTWMNENVQKLIHLSPPLYHTGTTKRSSVQGEEKVASSSSAAVGTLTLQKGSNFNTMPASMAKVHLQNVADYTSHTLTMRREKGSSGATKAISTELPGAKSIYICDSELFKQLDGEVHRSGGEGGGSGSEGGGGKGPGYVILPGNGAATIKATKGKEEQLPQTRLIHLANHPVSGEPVPGFGLKSLPAEQISVSCCADRDSPARNLQGIARESQAAEGGESGSSGVVPKGETVSTLSMSSLEVWMSLCGQCVCRHQIHASHCNSIVVCESPEVSRASNSKKLSRSLVH